MDFITRLLNAVLMVALHITKPWAFHFTNIIFIFTADSVLELLNSYHHVGLIYSAVLILHHHSVFYPAGEWVDLDSCYAIKRTTLAYLIRNSSRRACNKGKFFLSSKQECQELYHIYKSCPLRLWLYNLEPHHWLVCLLLNFPLSQILNHCTFLNLLKLLKSRIGWFWKLDNQASERFQCCF